MSNLPQYSLPLVRCLQNLLWIYGAFLGSKENPTLQSRKFIFKNKDINK